jgi:hypothetical protein
MTGNAEELARIQLTLFTDALVIRGFTRANATRVTDILNQVQEPFLVLEEVTVEEFGERGQPIRAAYAQTNLEAVLFAVIDQRGDSAPGLRLVKQPELAIISVPPFRITGTIHLLPSNGDLRQGLATLTGRFIPVTGATYWSERVGEARQAADVLAVNRHRAQILAPHTEIDPWMGIDRMSPPRGPSSS